MDKHFIRDHCIGCVYSLVGSSPGFVAALCCHDYCHGVPGATPHGKAIADMDTCPKREVAKGQKEAA